MQVIVKEDKNEGLAAFMGKRVTLFCGIYIYEGVLVGINETSVKLEDAGLVYETGEFTNKAWRNRQAFPTGVWYVSTGAIESYGDLNKTA